MLGDPMTDISIAMEVDYFRMARDRYFVPMTVKIPGSELELAKQGGAETAKIDFIGEVKDAKGVTQGNVRDYPGDQAEGRDGGPVGEAHAGLRHRLHPGARQVHAEVPDARKRRPARWARSKPSSSCPI